MKFDQKTVVVTGAGSGIGQHLALELLNRGAKVAAVDISGEGLDETAALADAGEQLSLHVVARRRHHGSRGRRSSPRSGHRPSRLRRRRDQ